MITPTQIDDLNVLTQDTISELTDWLLQDICRRIAEAGAITGTAEYQIWRLKQLGMRKRELNKELARRLGITRHKLKELIADSAEQGYIQDIARLNVEAPAFKDNAALIQILDAAQKQADKDFTNTTQTIGFVTADGKFSPLTQAYQKACDFAHMQVATGATDYATAVKNATRTLVNNGVQSIDYASGRHVNVEAAVRRSIIGGIGLLVEKISKKNHDDYGADGWEISAHGMSAPDHEPYQGLQYTDRQYEQLNNTLKRRISTLNCKHIAFPIKYGVTPPIYTKEQLQQFKDDNAKGITYQGKHYTMYECTQKQRQIERSIRAAKRQIVAANASGDSGSKMEAQARLQRLNQEYNAFSRAAGLRPQYNRTDIGVKV